MLEDGEGIHSFIDHLDKGSQSSGYILEHSVNLLKKLILLSASSLGMNELPDFLKDVVKVDPRQSTKDSNFVAKVSNGRKNFKHRKFASFYKKLQVEEQLKPQDYENELKDDLKQSLRHQLTKNALENQKLKAKANQVPIYHPKKRVNLTAMRSFYREAKLLHSINDPIKEEHKSKLSNELQEALKFQLARLEGDLAGRKTNEATSNKKFGSDLSKSLRFQLSSMIRNLQPSKEKSLMDESKALTDEELKEALEVKLKAFNNH